MTAAPAALQAHYTTSSLLDRIKSGLREAGVDPEAPSAEDLKPVDEFHTGGIEATEALLSQLDITEGTRVVDLGSGIGGTARHVAATYGAEVMGIDLTPAFVETAEELSRMAGLGELTAFRVGSVTDLPLPDDSADLVTMFHVGMNIADKPALFGEAARVLAPGGRFALFDIMRRDGDREIRFPVPWASTPAQSFVEAPEVYREAAEAAGLRLVAERDRGDYAADYFRRTIARTEAEGLPPVGLHLLMGEAAMERYGNAVAAALEGATAPWEMIFGNG